MYKLSDEKQAPIGDGYDIYMRDMEWVISHAETLKALLSYRSNHMIEANKALALAAINTSIDALEELKKAMEEIQK